MRAAFAGTDPIAFSNHVDVPVKVDARKNTIVAARAQAAASARVAVAPEAIEEVERIEVETVGDTQPYADAMADIEKAIDGRDAAQAFGRFTPEGYKMFRTLVEDCGQVRIVRRGGPYELLKANGQVVARHCAVKVEYDDGREFMENVVFRFDPESHKVNSLAFALTKKAEDDIFNKAATWPTISRFTILQFMEDYQTAFALRRIDYLEKIFSDEALIMVGSELKVGKPTVPDSKVLSLGGKEYKFNRLSKQRYIQNLAAKFRQKEDIHLTFEDNETMIINAPSLKAFNKEGAAFAIQIRQMHSSRTYSDQGYLSLILDMSGRQPIINVRLWYPEKTGVVSLEDFISKFEF